MWNIINDLKAAGTTILLTTQYLDEADQLADQIIVIDGGKVIAEGTAKSLKSKIGNDRLELTFANQKSLDEAVSVLGKKVVETNTSDLTATTMIKDTNTDVRLTLDEIAKAKISILSMAVHKPTLDDVFLSLTGKQKHSTESEDK
jgi:ABC-2 type transport system ATP-binding protein